MAAGAADLHSGLIGSKGLPVKRLHAKLLGPFELTFGELSAGPWTRPTARRLMQLVLMSPGRRIGREQACEVLFPHLGAAEATNSLRKALSMAKAALSSLGDEASGLLLSDRSRIWVQQTLELDVDFELLQRALRSALSLPPGEDRDQCLEDALSAPGALLEDEPYADWALRPREELEALRHEARLALARDRSNGFGRTGSDDVLYAWEACSRADPASEEAAIKLIQAYSRSGRHAQAAAAYKRCCAALEELGIRVSPALERVIEASAGAARREADHRPSAPDEERRLITVLFAELVEAAGETEWVEPEDQRERVGGALTDIVGTVESFGGTVSAVSGTGVVALFGAPESHEDDPERALRAATSAVARIHKRADGLSLRVGVESGPAVVGSIGGGSSHHYAALGDVVRIAGALQSQAGTASVLVGPATYRATEGIFDWGAAQEVAVYPEAKPILANYIQRQKPRRQSEVGRRRLAGAAPLVGREAELSVVREALSDATGGSGRVLAVIGEPGLGKTRLVQECRKLFTSWVEGVPGRLPLWLEARAASYGSTQPYGLYQQLLAAWLGITPEDSERGCRAALERALKATYAGKLDADQTRLLSHVLGIGAGGTAALVSRLGPEKFQQACFSAVRDLLGRIMGHGPTVVVLEDLHWADPTSLRLTETISSLTNEGPLLILVTRRPEPDRGTSMFETALLSGGEGRLRLELSPLAEGSERELARALLGGGASQEGGASEEIVSAISEGVDGNPLFMEERVTSLLETKALRRGDEGGWRLDVGAPGQVPEVLDRLVRARVDRLDPAPRQAVIAASVLGPEFSLRDLAPVTDLNGGLLPAVLELCSANLLLEQRQLSEPTYRFRHSLIQDAIYKGLLKQQRRHLHARAASGLEAASPVPEEIAGLLGRHYAMAGEVDRAVRYLELAGDAAAATYANDEAIASYRLALELFSEQPGSATEAVSLWLKLGALFWRLGDYSEGRAALGEAAARSPAGAPLLEARCYRWLGQLEIEDGRDEDAFAALDKAEEVLQACSDKNSDDWLENWLDLQLSRSNLHYWRNETERQGQVLERARPVVEGRAGPWKKADFAVHVAGNRWRARRFAVDDKTIEDVTAARQVVADAGLKIEEFHWHTLGSLLLLYGDLAKARTELEGALDAARRAGDKSLELANLVFLAWAHMRQHDVAGTEKIVRAGSELVCSRNFPSAGMVKALQSWVEWKLGRAAQAERAAIEALDEWRPNIVRYPFCAICLWPLIAVRLAEGRHAAAVEAARELLRPPQMRFPDDLEADVALAISSWDNGDAPAAVQALNKALNLAQALRFA